MGEDRTTGDLRDEPRTNQRLTVAQAAEALGITEGAVRSRIKRGTLPTVKEGTSVYVVLGAGTSGANQSTYNDEPYGGPSDQTGLIESLQDQIEYLRGQLEAEREAGRRKDHLLAAALERIPAIEAPRDEPRAPETATEGESDTETPADDTEEPRRSSWWRRFFGFE